VNPKAEQVGTVAQLYTTATKGFAVNEVEHIEVTYSGIVGNREFFLVDIDERLYSVPKDPIFLDYWTTYDPLANVLRVGGERLSSAKPNYALQVLFVRSTSTSAQSTGSGLRVHGTHGSPSWPGAAFDWFDALSPAQVGTCTLSPSSRQPR
jgi:hypothetical protein